MVFSRSELPQSGLLRFVGVSLTDAAHPKD
jgi:hypothetical protein